MATYTTPPKKTTRGISQTQSLFYQHYVVAAVLQKLLVEMGDSGQDLGENLGGAQTDSNPPETQQQETTPRKVPGVCAQ